MFSKADGFALGFGERRRLHKFSDFSENIDDRLFMNIKPPGQLLFEFHQFLGKGSASAQSLTHLDKSANDEYAHLDSAPDIQDIRRHDWTVLAECIGQCSSTSTALV